MELCVRGGALLAAKGAPGGWGLWRAWLRLRGNAALGGQRGKSTGPFAGGGQQQQQQQDWSHRNKTVLTYLAAAVVGMAGVSYAAVPLYRLYCQVRGRAVQWLQRQVPTLLIGISQVAPASRGCGAFRNGAAAWSQDSALFA